MPSIYLKKIIAVCFAANLVCAAAIFFLQKKLPPVVPLFYGLPVSKSQLAPSLGLTIPSVVTIFFLCVNYLIVKFSKDKFLEKILGGVSIATCLLSLITTINIFTLVGSW